MRCYDQARTVDSKNSATRVEHIVEVVLTDGGRVKTAKVIGDSFGEFGCKSQTTHSHDAALEIGHAAKAIDDTKPAEPARQAM